MVISLIGFNKLVVAKTSYRNKLPDITRSVDSIPNEQMILYLSILSEKATDAKSVERLEFRYEFRIQPRRVNFNEVNIRVGEGVDQCVKGICCLLSELPFLIVEILILIWRLLMATYVLISLSQF